MSGQRSLPSGTVTFMFTDIEGSTRLVQALGERYPALLARHHALLRSAIADGGGVEVSTEGDAFFAAFDSAAAATGAAVAAQRALAAEAWPDDAPVRVRMGLHSGAGETLDDTYVGLDVHRAARIAAAGHGGQVLVSDATRSLLGTPPTGPAVRDLGEHRLKDLVAAERIFQLVIDGLTADFPPLRTLDARRGNLPAPPTSFVGREADVNAVSALLATSRLVTLTGPGGTGKTRLSIEVASRVASGYPGGAWFVALEAVRDPALVLPQLAVTLGVPEQPGQPIEAALNAHLAAQPTLLVIDNLEQVIAAGPALGRLVGAQPALRMLVSSREPLRVTGEQEFPVPPLADEPAGLLFTERARLIQPDFLPAGATIEAVREIGRRLDGLPLAIELAAARIRVLSPEQIRDRLGERLRLLSGGSRDLSDRQRTLRGAIEWSHQLLDEPERRFFDRLGVFAGHPDLDAIAAVIDPAGELGIDALDAVERLVEKSLLRRSEVAGAPRFGFLETIREFAREQLAADRNAAAEALRARHAEHYAAIAASLEPKLLGANPGPLFDALEADHDEMRTLLRWSLESGQLRLGLRTAAALWRFWQHRGHLAEGRRLLDQLLAQPAGAGDSMERATALTALGGVAYWQDDMPATSAAYEQALAMNRRLGDSRAIAGSLYDISFSLAIGGDLDAARQALAEAAERYAAVGDDHGATLVREALAVTAARAGDMAAAREIEEEVVRGYRARGQDYKLADGLALLTVVLLNLGDVMAARNCLGESVAISRRIGDLSALVSQLQLAAIIALREDRLDDAALFCGALARVRETLGDSLQPAITLGLRQPEDELAERLDAAALAAGLERGRAAEPTILLDEIARLHLPS